MGEDPTGASGRSRLRRYRWWIIGAAVLAVLNLVIVGVMVLSVLNDNDLRRTEDPIEATVVENGDDGFPLVEFEIDGEASTAEIDVTGARPPIDDVGQHVLVVVDQVNGYAVPALVDSSAIWIENLVVAAAICFLLDVVVLCIAGATFVVRERRRTPRTDNTAFSAPIGLTALPTTSIRLRSWGFARRSSLEIGPNRLLAHLPGWFGDVPLVVPLMDLSIADPGAAEANDRTRLPLREPVIPLMRTRANFDEPDLTLLFAHPVRVPPLRLLQSGNPHLSRKRSRRDPGVFIDGMVLTVGDPGAAMAVLRQRDVPVVDPARWASETVGELIDPAMVAARRRDTRRAGTLSGASRAAMFGAVVLAGWSTFGDETDPVPIAIALVLTAVAALAHLAGRRIHP